MKRKLLLLILIIVVPAIFAQQRFSSQPDWQQEFRGRGHIDTQYWTGARSVGKTTLQYYAGVREENVYLKHGKLHIVLKKDSIGERDYSSARVISKDTFLCGKFSFRAKYPISQGTWTNIWLKSYKFGDLHGEIDMVEYTSKWGKDKFQFNLHTTGKYKGNKKYHKQYKKYIKIDVSKWHTYTLEWYPDSMIMYVDGVKMAEQHREDLEVWPFNDNYYKIYMNVHYGGMGGDPDDSQLPQELLVDWIRYYKLKE